MRLNTRTSLRLDILSSFLFLLLFAVPAISASDDDFSIYIAQSREPEELTETAKKLVSNVRISHMNNKIVVYGPKSGREAAIRLMKELDSPSKNFKVWVRAAGKGAAEREARALEGGIEVTKGVRIGKKSGVLKGKNGGTIAVGNESGSIGYTAESESTETANRGGQSVTVMDGGTGMISASDLFTTAMSVKVKSIGKNGARITLQQKNRSNTGDQQLATELDLKLGEWRTIGGVNQSNESASRELLGGSKSSITMKQDVQIMVEEDVN